MEDDTVEQPLYTGNTTYGVQNLEYDPHTNAFFMAVYTGKKPAYPNYSLFAADASVPAENRVFEGIGENGEVLSLMPIGDRDEVTGIRSWRFPYGSTGMCALGDGNWLIAESRRSTGGQCGYIFQYVWDEKAGFLVKDQ